MSVCGSPTSARRWTRSAPRWASRGPSAGENTARPLWTPEGGLQEIHLKYTYSAEGPQHIELLEGPAGTFWDGTVSPGAHHVGVWADDVQAETDRLVSLGWTLVGAQQDPGAGAGVGMFTYLRPPSGLIVELVDSAVLPFFNSGGPTPSEPVPPPGPALR